MGGNYMKEKEFKGHPLKLKSLVNVRDYGGYQTKSGTILPKKVLRGAELYGLDSGDQDILMKEYQLKQVIDFRTTVEDQARPDPKLPNVQNHFINILGDDSPVSADPAEIMKEMSQTGADPESYLLEIYRDFITSFHAHQGYQQFFNLLLQEKKGATYFHCTAGKDRTGFGGALFLSALDADNDLIMADFLLSNTYRKAYNQQVLAQLKSANAPIQQINMAKVALEVRPEYLEASYQTMLKEFGSADNYLKEALDLTDDKRELLKELYLTNR